MIKKLNFITKRDNSVAPFDESRIKNAIFLAARELGGKDDVRAAFLTEKVVDNLSEIYTENTPPTVENVQDMVEQVLIEHGHTKTARAFIRYRDKRSIIREEKKRKLLEQIANHQATITNQDGSKEPFEIEKIISVLSYYSYDLNKINIKNLVTEAVLNLYDGISVKELEKSLINAARSKIEINAQYSMLAARLLLKSLYQSVLNVSVTNDHKKFKKTYRKNFADYVRRGVELELLDQRMVDNFDLEELSKNLIPARDDLFHFRGLQSIYDRYLLKAGGTEIFELPQYLWMRVAMGVALAEKDQADRQKYAVEFYHIMSEMFYIPSTPTLFNAGTRYAQLSSCFLNSVDDSLEAIFKSYSDNAKLSKYSGGIGTDWTNVRALGSLIKGTNGFSQGVIPFLKIFNDVALAVNQGGKRKGAMCAYLEVWHADIYEFIEAKKNTGDERRRLHDCHTAIWVPDLFMQRLNENGEWTLFSPSEVPNLHNLYGEAFAEQYVKYENMGLKSAKKISATSIWRKILTMLFETGHPWITFKDACNIRNPQSHVGVIHNSNLCTEITLNNSQDETAVCNLGSLNLEKFVIRQHLDLKLLKKVTTLAMRMLDNVIDVNFYPTVEAKNANKRHRPVGLGIMGYQDVLYKLGYGFDSKEHLELADFLMENISYFAISASSDLAHERGAYSSFEGSYWDLGIFPLDSLKILEKQRNFPLKINMQHTKDWEKLKAKVKRQKMRNSNCLAIAPTATISNIAGVYPCIEPAFRNIYVKENTDGSFIVINQYMVSELEELGLWNEELLNEIKLNNGSIQNIKLIPPALKARYKEAFEIDPIWLIHACALRGKWIDQSQSLNIFMDKSSGKALSQAYVAAFEMGLKTTYYLRTLSASQVTKSNIKDTTSYYRQQKQSVSSEQPASIIESTLEDSLTISIGSMGDQINDMPTQKLAAFDKNSATPGENSHHLLGAQQTHNIASSANRAHLADRDQHIAVSQKNSTDKLSPAGENLAMANGADMARSSSSLAAENILDNKPKLGENSETTTSQPAKKNLNANLCRIDDPDCEACQ